VSDDTGADFGRVGAARVLLAGLAAGALMVAGCGGCARTVGPRIRAAPPGTGAAIALPNTVAGVPYAVDDATVCLTGPGAVVVDRIQIVRPTGGMRVARFALRPVRGGPTYNYIDDRHQRLVDVGYPGTGPMVADRPCAPDHRPPAHGEGATLVGVELVKPGDATATGSGFEISYRLGRHRYRVYLPFGVILCAGLPAERAECDRGVRFGPP
jgi:hypothetical protein